MVALKCCICFSSRSDQCPPTRAAEEDWCAFTSCGHVYHLSCVERWHTVDRTLGCPNRCPSLNVKRKKHVDSNLQVPLPYLRLFVHSREGDAPSSDALAAEGEKPRVKREKGKGKARAVSDDEEEEEDDDDASAGGQDELVRLRRERDDALNTIRDQRVQLVRLIDEVRRLQEAVGAPAPALPVAGPSRGAAQPQPRVRSVFAARANVSPRQSRFFARVQSREESPSEDEADPRELGGGRGPYGDESWPGTDEEYNDCEDCGQEHRGDCEPFAVELFAAQAEITRLKDVARQNDPRAIAALTAQLRSVQTRLNALQEAHDELVEHKDEQERRFHELQNEINEANVRWRQEKRRLEEKVRTSGASGQEIIRQLEAEISEKDREILLIKGKIDGAEYLAEKALEEKANALEQARREVAKAKAAAQDQIAAAQQQCSAEHEARRRIERANEVMRRKLTRYKIKLRDAQTKRGILATESDDEDEDAPAPDPAAPTASTSTTLSRTRSRVSTSPDPAASAAFRINNNSRLLASPTKRAHARTAMDACDVSREEGIEEESDDDLEYVDEPIVPKEEEEEQADAENRPPVTLDSDSDIEIVESSYFRRPAASAPVRPLGARSSASNVLPSSSSAGAAAGKKRAFGLTTLADGSGSAGGWVAKKPALSQAKSDKYLPDFASGLAGTGPKHRVKRK
ncbi:hypothetical protein JCM10450v2_003716 [Rhodotorula kratochvilovae]